MNPNLTNAFPEGTIGKVISEGAIIAPSAYIGNHVTIYPRVRVGEEAIILDGAVLGRLPISNATSTRPIPNDFSDLTIGAGSIIGCNSVIYTGSRIGSQVLIGDQASLREGSEIGDQVIIGRGVQMLYECKIGNRSRIQDQVHLVGNLVVEEDVFIGMGVMTSNDNNVYLARFGLTGLDLHGPIIRRFAVIGTGAVLLPGVEIGTGAMVAAGAVVTRNVAPWTVVAGIPAQYLKDIPSDWREQIESTQIKARA
jgi:acetyltransferase-like isoleucine patch superfamily enzyme